MGLTTRDPGDALAEGVVVGEGASGPICEDGDAAEEPLSSELEDCGSDIPSVGESLAVTAPVAMERRRKQKRAPEKYPKALIVFLAVSYMYVKAVEANASVASFAKETCDAGVVIAFMAAILLAAGAIRRESGAFAQLATVEIPTAALLFLVQSDVLEGLRA